MANLPQGVSPLKPMTRREIALWGKEERRARLIDLGLSERQADVAALLLDGDPNKVIADYLCITTKTVRFHLTYIYKILKVKNRYESFVKLKSMGVL